MEPTPLEPEVNPCPFCGHSTVIIREGSSFRWRYACCDGCGAQAPEIRIQTLGDGTPGEWEKTATIEAIEEWNKRTPAPDCGLDALRSENDALSARVEALEGFAKSIYEAPMGNFESIYEWKSWATNRAYQISNRPPALDLAAHDERVRRDALEQASQSDTPGDQEAGNLLLGDSMRCRTPKEVLEWDALTAERDALSARVEALRLALGQADIVIHAHRFLRKGYGVTDPGPCDFCDALASTPALDLAKHDETVRRDALEQASRRWIPCEESNPEDGDQVNISGISPLDGSRWVSCGEWGYLETYPPDYWMPLPIPPSTETEEK